MPCLLDTGSQVTLFSKAFFQKCLGDQPLKGTVDIAWLTLRAENRLEIPYIGYTVLDFEVGGVKIPAQVVIVKNECLGAEKGILGMNVIAACWNEIFQNQQHQKPAFVTVMEPAARGEW